MTLEEYRQREALSSGYHGLAASGREALLYAVAERYPDFRLLRFRRFEQFGRHTDTAVYACNDAEFVFVPGGMVTLGWESFATPMNERTREEISEALAEWGIVDIDTYLRENMSPVRSVVIPPMLVERLVNPIGWRQVDIDSPELACFGEYVEGGKRYLSSNPNKCYELHNGFKMHRENGKIIAYIYEPTPLEALRSKLTDGGFSLPTEDEWEYLCGGGSRTLFRWGDSFDFEMKLHHVKSDSDEPYTLKEPNQFGLSIAYDPYMWEVCEDSEHFLKGGDGGCNFCGGMGLVAGYLPVATYFRTPMSEDENGDWDEDIGGDYTFYRRIVRV